jgi:hypothetical protein
MIQIKLKNRINLPKYSETSLGPSLWPPSCGPGIINLISSSEQIKFHRSVQPMSIITKSHSAPEGPNFQLSAGNPSIEQ